MQEDLNWFSTFLSSENYKHFLTQPVAYFSAEFAVSDSLPIYAGGLGVLAGDILREAADRTFPLIGVGLFYREGYLHQKVDDAGTIIETSATTLPEQAGLSPVMNKGGMRIFVKVPIHDREVFVQAWIYKERSVPLYLLDTNVEQNSAEDRAITNRLYVRDKETRLKQEMVLGIGGVRLLEALSIHPSVYHLNEGHSAMLILDLMRHEMVKRQVSFRDAIALAKRHIVFTNHTLLSVGNEVFSNDLVSTLLSKYAEELQVPPNEIVSLGLIQESSRFSMTMLSLRIASRINAVSRMHQKKARDIWADHPMESITNGIHIPSWDGDTEDLWKHRQEKKRLLLAYVKEQTGVVWGEDELLLGWARRMVSYKRPLALFQNVEQFRALATREGKHVRVIVSGFAPPGDVDGAMLLQQIQHLAKNELKEYVVYLPQYTMTLAKILTAGCDVWLNTPVVGFEACGTSGMKAALNGTLPVSTRDGWIEESELFRVGWVLDSDRVHTSLMNILRQDVVPMYYTNKEDWLAHMKNSREMILNQFTATKMLRLYIEKMYLPVQQEIGH